MKVIDNAAGLEVDTSEHPGYLLWDEGPLGFKPPILNVHADSVSADWQLANGSLIRFTESDGAPLVGSEFSTMWTDYEDTHGLVREYRDRVADQMTRGRFRVFPQAGIHQGPLPPMSEAVATMPQSDSDDEEEATRCIERNYPGLDEDNRTDFEEYLDAIIDIRKEHEAAETVRREARSLDHLAWLADCRRLAHAFYTCVNSNQAFDAEKLRRASVSIDITLDTIGAIP